MIKSKNKSTLIDSISRSMEAEGFDFDNVKSILGQKI